MKKVLLLLVLGVSLTIGLTSMFSEDNQQDSPCKSMCQIITADGEVTWGDCMKACNSCKEPSLSTSPGNRASCNCHYWELIGIFDAIGEELGFETHGECVTTIKPFFQE
jgi:hypothetical protein